jgi:acetyl-CoA carboxylase alpha subunit
MNELQESIKLLKIQKGIKNGVDMTADINTLEDSELRDGMTAYQQLKKSKSIVQHRRHKKSKPKTKSCKCK